MNNYYEETRAPKNKDWWIFKLNLLVLSFVVVAYGIYFVQSGKLDRYLTAFGFAEVTPSSRKVEANPKKNRNPTRKARMVFDKKQPEK